MPSKKVTGGVEMFAGVDIPLKKRPELRKRYDQGKTIEVGVGVTVNKNIMSGVPVIKGRRFPVHMILEYLTDYTLEELLEEFGLKKEEVFVALKYAAKVVEKQRGV